MGWSDAYRIRLVRVNISFSIKQQINDRPLKEKKGNYPFPLVAQTEGTDGGPPRLLGPALPLCVDRRAEAGLAVTLALLGKQHVGQVGDVAGGQAKSLDL